MLSPLGHRITRVRDGEQALAELQAGAFDLVLMDVLMPGLDGLEATPLAGARPRNSGRARRLLRSPPRHFERRETVAGGRL
jgi:CheY-like chemotaxis protein